MAVNGGSLRLGAWKVIRGNMVRVAFGTNATMLTLKAK